MTALTRALTISSKAASSGSPLRTMKVRSSMPRDRAASWFCSRNDLREGVRCIHEHGDALCGGHYLPDEFEVLGRKLRGCTGHSRDVAAGPGEAGDETRCHRIGCRRHDDRNRLRGLFGGHGGRRLKGDDDIDVQAHQLGGQLGQPIVLSFGPARLHAQVRAFDIARSRRFATSAAAQLVPLATEPGPSSPIRASFAAGTCASDDNGAAKAPAPSAMTSLRRLFISLPRKAAIMPSRAEGSRLKSHCRDAGAEWRSIADWDALLSDGRSPADHCSTFCPGSTCPRPLPHTESQSRLATMEHPSTNTECGSRIANAPSVFGKMPAITRGTSTTRSSTEAGPLSSAE